MAKNKSTQHMQTTIEVRPRSKTAPPQLIPVAEAVVELRDVREMNAKLTAEIADRQAELEKANRVAIELQDRYADLKATRARLLDECRHAEFDVPFHAERIAVLEQQVEHLWAAGNDPVDHIRELQWRAVLVERLPAWLKARRAALVKADGEIVEFEKIHLLPKK
jgi:chromosome segregation ATPase